MRSTDTVKKIKKILISATGHEGITWCSHVAVLKQNKTKKIETHSRRKASVSLRPRSLSSDPAGWLHSGCFSPHGVTRSWPRYCDLPAAQLRCAAGGPRLTVSTLLPSGRCLNGPNAAAGRRGRRRRWRSPSTQTPRASRGRPSQLTVVTAGHCWPACASQILAC